MKTTGNEIYMLDKKLSHWKKNKIKNGVKEDPAHVRRRLCLLREKEVEMNENFCLFILYILCE